MREARSPGQPALSEDEGASPPQPSSSSSSGFSSIAMSRNSSESKTSPQSWHSTNSMSSSRATTRTLGCLQSVSMLATWGIAVAIPESLRLEAIVLKSTRPARSGDLEQKLQSHSNSGIARIPAFSARLYLPHPFCQGGKSRENGLLHLSDSLTDSSTFNIPHGAAEGLVTTQNCSNHALYACLSRPILETRPTEMVLSLC